MRDAGITQKRREGGGRKDLWYCGVGVSHSYVMSTDGRNRYAMRALDKSIVQSRGGRHFPPKSAPNLSIFPRIHSMIE